MLIRTAEFGQIQTLGGTWDMRVPFPVDLAQYSCSAKTRTLDMKKRSIAVTIFTAFIAVLAVPTRAVNIPAGMDCSAIPRTTDYLRGHRIVMFGEGHGTKESPATFLRIVCAALRQGASVAVGLEMPVDLNEPLATYLQSTGDLAARTALLRTEFWKQGQDGRASVAMADMIDGLRRLRQAGYSLEVFAMQGAGADWHLRNDEKMATRIREAFNAAPTSLILTLTGNVHSMKTKPEWFPAEVPAPIPTYLKDLAPVTFDLTSTGGSAWSCQKECGPRAESVRSGPDEFVVAASGMGDAYTGQINIGKTTASPPAAAEPHY
ncbi:hypothetical protein NX784_19050 [Massilia pinisoli]|uniref:Haem-binding uptake Tiki superfamily ChaN domain-containing protein n=1 Tax=Massilia pinisoli TaxID=1772194 RepID=A0ABT1ZUR0_9BURK|nr:hypothetical protein [Massilia pinisoli]MCS0583695.1 hypothetical protein [Massilia pinisoli]